MENLASYDYDTYLDNQVKKELNLAHIPVMRLPCYMNAEVKTTYIGILNGFVFSRAWTYWVCEGDMPLAIAETLYDQYKDLNIRAGGHAGNEPPSSQSYNPEYEKQLDYFFAHSKIKDIHERIQVAKDSVIENMSLPRFVKCYHIDTQLGLIKLADTIRENAVITENKWIQS